MALRTHLTTPCARDACCQSASSTKPPYEPPPLSSLPLHTAANVLRRQAASAEVLLARIALLALGGLCLKLRLGRLKLFQVGLGASQAKQPYATAGRDDAYQEPRGCTLLSARAAQPRPPYHELRDGLALGLELLRQLELVAFPIGRTQQVPQKQPLTQCWRQGPAPSVDARVVRFGPGGSAGGGRVGATYTMSCNLTSSERCTSSRGLVLAKISISPSSIVLRLKLSPTSLACVSCVSSCPHGRGHTQRWWPRTPVGRKGQHTDAHWPAAAIHQLGAAGARPRPGDTRLGRTFSLLA